jgi:hypothetical protein
LENLKRTDHLEDLDVARKILKEIGWRAMDWIHLAQDMDQWRAVVDTIINLRVP